MSPQNKTEEKCCEKCLEKVENSLPDGEVYQWEYQCRNSSCPCHTHPQEEKSWEERFDKRFEKKHFLYDGCLEYDLEAEVKSFIRQELAQAKTEVLERVKETIEKMKKNPDKYENYSYFRQYTPRGAYLCALDDLLNNLSKSNEE